MGVLCVCHLSVLSSSAGGWLSCYLWGAYPMYSTLTVLTPEDSAVNSLIFRATLHVRWAIAVLSLLVGKYKFGCQ